jgi:hypothetical protein
MEFSHKSLCAFPVVSQVAMNVSKVAVNMSQVAVNMSQVAVNVSQNVGTIDFLFATMNKK